MVKPPVLPLYVRDFLVDTQHFTPAEVGAYIRLLATQWVQPLPAATPDLARISGMRLEAFGRAWRRVLRDKFREVSPGIVANPRLESERQGVEAKRLRKVEAGKAGANARWQPHPMDNGTRNAVAMAERCPAVAVAVATATRPTPGAREGSDEQDVRDNLRRPEYLTALDGILRVARNPEALASSIRACGPGGIQECGSWAEIGKALQDLAAAGGAITPVAIRAFVKRSKAEATAIAGGDARYRKPDPPAPVTRQPMPKMMTPGEIMAEMDEHEAAGKAAREKIA